MEASGTAMAKFEEDLPPEFSKEQFGARLRQIRTMRKLSLAELSQLSKISVAMLSHVERGNTMPSLTTLQRISQALDFPLSEMFRGVGEKDTVGEGVVVRRDERIRMQFAQNGLAKELLSPNRASDLEMLMLIIEPGAHSGSQPWRRNSEKAGMVLNGRFELTVGQELFELEAGDSFQFDGNIPHRFRNLSNEEARVLWIIRSESIA